MQVAGSDPVIYQWRFQGEELPGEPLPWLELTGVTRTKTGSCDVVVPSATGAVTPSATATVSLLSIEPFAAFLARHGIEHWGGDGDRDGINAALEWFLGGDPNSSDPLILPQGHFTSPGTFTVTFLMPEQTGSATWSLPSGRDFDGWNPAIDGANGVIIATGAAVDGRVPVTVTSTEITSPFFTRLVVKIPE